MDAKYFLAALAWLTACGAATSAGGGTTDDVAVDAAATDGTTADVAGTDAAGTDAVGTDAAGTDAVADIAGTDAATADAAAPDVDAPDSAGTDAATADVPAAPFSAVQAVFDARCTNCHSAQALGLPGYAKLPLTSDVAWANLVNQPAHETCGGTLVVPGKPDASYLWQKLTADTPCDGGHMPAKFEVMPAPPLTADQLAAVHDWIAGGAGK